MKLELSVAEHRESLRFKGIIQLGRLALWNLLTRTVVKGNDRTLDLLKITNRVEFDELMQGGR